MSKFAVEVRRISATFPHPNAHSLQLAQLEGFGYQFITGVEAYEGQPVVYFPLDSVLPTALQEHLGLDKTRIKAKKLRGMVSEGLLIPAGQIEAYLNEPIAVGNDLTDRLGVTKFDPHPFNTMVRGSGSRPDQLIALPVGVTVYDIENAGRYPDVVASLQDEWVVVTEKVEGSHWWARLDADGQTYHVGQRRFEIKMDETTVSHPWIVAFHQFNYAEVLRQLWQYYRGYDVLIRGEIIGDGVQGNYYGLPTGKRDVYLFEIEVGGKPIDAVAFGTWVSELSLRAVPPVYIGKLSGYATTAHELTERASGQSQLKDRLREGIVVKPAAEKYHPEIGRTIIKVRDPIYLAQ